MRGHQKGRKEGKQRDRKKRSELERDKEREVGVGREVEPGWETKEPRMPLCECFMSAAKLSQ